MRHLLLILLLLALISFPAQANSWITIPVQAVIVSDDDGGRAAFTSNEEIQEQIDFANKVFKAAYIRFDYTPSDTNPSAASNTILNNVTGDSDKTWEQNKYLGNYIAGQFPGKMLILFRYGPGRKPTGAGFSWYSYNFIVMPAYSAAWHCGHKHVDGLAHEIGHYLGLAHTFATHPFETKEEALFYLQENRNNPMAFDGDRLSDTRPDPAIRNLECNKKVKQINLGGTVFTLPRKNIMSYYDERDSLSPSQIQRVRQIAIQRFGN